MEMTMQVKATIIGLGLTLSLLPAAARAQTASAGAIAGTVRDTTGAVLPGVSVEASSPALIERVRNVVTDEGGQYRIVDLRPGAYSLTFTLPGFSTVRRDGVELTVGFTATVNAELRVGDVSETITVSGQSPVVDVQNVSQSRVLTREALDAIPTGKLYSNLGMLLPGAITGGVQRNTQDVGGAQGQAFVILGIHGGRTTDEQVQLDGMQYQMAYAQGGASPVLVPVDGTIQEYNMEYSGHSAEMESGGVRINMISKVGGNSFHGTFFGNFTNDTLMSSNFDDDLKGRGLTIPDKVKHVWVVNPAFGGPILRDRLWFFTSAQAGSTSNYVAGLYMNKTPGTFVYTPNLDRQAEDDQDTQAANLRLTWQATSRNKFSVYYDHNHLCACHYLISPTRAPEASWNVDFLNRVAQATWASPVTNRLLFEAGGFMYNVDYIAKPQADASAPPVTEASSGLLYRAGAYNFYYSRFYHSRGAVSYVTGAHALKVGVDVKFGSGQQDAFVPGDFSYTLLRGTPLSVTYNATPYTVRSLLRPNLGLYVQDQWTHKRLTVNGGLRFDWFRTRYPSYVVPATQFVPQREVVGAEVLNWKDLNPRIGVAIDLFGTGKTAVKSTLSRYVVQEAIGIGVTGQANPISASLNTNTRNWTDANGDFVVQGDPLNPEINGELGVSSNRNFGRTIITNTFDPDWRNGFGTREYNWEFSAGIQHEVLPRVSLNASFFRRHYGNLRVTQNRAVTPADFDPYCVSAPADSRLPGGGGQQLCGYDITPQKVGRVDNFITRAETFGKQDENWNGVDLTVNARLPRGGLVQGGLSTGKTMTDNCDIVTKIANAPSAAGGGPSTMYCHIETPFLTQVKVIGSYTLPRGYQLSGSFQSIPGPQIGATYLVRNAVIAPSLGRNLSSGANGTVTLNLVPGGQAAPQGGNPTPGTFFGERLNQIDFRFAKRFQIGESRSIQPMVDLYNILNANAVLRVNNTYGTDGSSWLVPTVVETARLIKFGVQVNF
jgi:hypothetical protein